jgi:hypothetical protein
MILLAASGTWCKKNEAPRIDGKSWGEDPATPIKSHQMLCSPFLKQMFEISWDDILLIF